jgi:hypothetical protein
LKALVERRRQTAICIVSWPTWTLDTDRLLTQIKDGELAQVTLSWAPGSRSIWVLRVGKSIRAATALSHATEADIRAWLETEWWKQIAPRPSGAVRNPVDEIFQP